MRSMLTGGNVGAGASGNEEEFNLLKALKGGGAFAGTPAPDPVKATPYNQPFSQDFIPNFGIGPGGGLVHPDLNPYYTGESLQGYSITNPQTFTDVFESGGGLPTLGTSGGGGGWGTGGGNFSIPAQDTNVTWKVGNYKAFGPNIPSWWQPLTPEGAAATDRPDVQFSLMLNAMIPYLSPEDQVTVGRKLYETWGDDFGVYKDISLAGTAGQAGSGQVLPNTNPFGGAVSSKPVERSAGGKSTISSVLDSSITKSAPKGKGLGAAPISGEQSMIGIEGPVANEDFFRGTDRAEFARRTLDSIRENVSSNIGEGGRFMENILNAIQQTGGRNTRASTVSMMGQIDPMLAGAQGGALSAFGPLGSMLTNPFFSRFQQQPVQRTQSGQFLFGQANPLLQF